MDFSSICRIFTTILLWLESGKCARASMCWGLLKLPRGRISLRVTHLNQQGLMPGLPAHLCPLLGSGLLPTRLLLGDPPLPGPCHPAQGGSVRGATSAGAAGTAAMRGLGLFSLCRLGNEVQRGCGDAVLGCELSDLCPRCSYG